MLPRSYGELIRSFRIKYLRVFLHELLTLTSTFKRGLTHAVGRAEGALRRVQERGKYRPIFGTTNKEALRRERLSCNELGLSSTLFLGSALRHAVVLFGVDVLRCPVLFVVDLRPLTIGQSAAVGLAVRGDLLVDALLLIFQLRGFTGG